ncbi:MAG: GspE/PulE family protein [Puniceicoccales bacterium]|jgi:type II secretory ATPase GspE/PulE/Tfp pilus assembly ATPase PilB-like protein|nr:GspE/PulE family protein [Puniceicoccales bacterium]
MENLDKVLATVDPALPIEIANSPIDKKIEILAEKLTQTPLDAYEWLSSMCGLPFAKKFTVSKEITKILPEKLLLEYACLPINLEDGRQGLIFGWVPDATMKKWIKATSSADFVYCLGPIQEIRKFINERFGVGAGSFTDTGSNEGLIAKIETVQEDEDAVVIKFVNELIKQALADRATDIHFEPQKNSLQIRYRIDGALVPVSLPPNLVLYQAAIISRLKIMAKLNISEKRRPQDGRIAFRSGDTAIDIRVSTLPISYGESISLRLLNLSEAPVELDGMGLGQKQLDQIVNAISRPHGIVLVTGPTGSGKSTMLNACIHKIRNPEIRIITVEDPVEYEIAGINQCQVQSDIGMTFASALRSILRQDPDVIMIGEIRDAETADIAIRASITGHMVLSTLHTNDSAGAVSRLCDMGLEPFLLASSLQLVLAQRLVRKICLHCAKKANYTPDELEYALRALRVDPTQELAHIDKMMVGTGCDRCKNGYKGRIAVHEVLVISDKIQQAIIKNAPAREIRTIALGEGMQTLQACAWEHVKQGRTTLDEIMQFADKNNMEEG